MHAGIMLGLASMSPTIPNEPLMGINESLDSKLSLHQKGVPLPLRLSRQKNLALTGVLLWRGLQRKGMIKRHIRDVINLNEHYPAKEKIQRVFLSRS
jgi:hypothetical protein